MPVVVGNGFGGVLLHEAIGHGLEADAVQKEASVYAGRVGDKLAEEFVIAYDDGRLPGAWGSDAVDDEGTPTQRTTIIEGGKLTSYLYDSLRAHKGKALSTGNGRRESFRHLPLPRMTNTYFAPGEATPEDLIAGTERGLYAVSFGGGQVEPATGDFVFGVSEGYLIEGGKVTAPVRGATLIGNGPEALAADRRDRRRPRDRDRLLREGRAARARRRGPAARADQGAHRRRHGVTLEEAAAAALAAAEAVGATDAEAWAEESQGLEVRVYKQAVESLTDAGGRGLGLRVFVDGRVGYAYGTDLSDAGVRALAESAHAGAAAADADEYDGLPDAFGDDAGGGPVLATRSRTGPPSARSSSRRRSTRAARGARGRDAGGADRLRRLARAGRARQQPRLHLGVRGELGVGLLVGVRRRRAPT